MTSPRPIPADLSGVSAKEILELAHAHQVRFLRLQFTDILGINKNVEVPASQFPKALAGDILFDGSSALAGGGATPIMSMYFTAASGGPRPSCEASARTAASSAGIVGHACAPGVVANVPGGSPCVASSGTIDAAMFTCDAHDDLALALAGSTPSAIYVTRLAGRIAPTMFGNDEPIVPSDGAFPSPVFAAGASATPVARTVAEVECQGSSATLLMHPGNGGKAIWDISLGNVNNAPSFLIQRVEVTFYVGGEPAGSFDNSTGQKTGFGEPITCAFEVHKDGFDAYGTLHLVQLR